MTMDYGTLVNLDQKFNQIYDDMIDYGERISALEKRFLNAQKVWVGVDEALPRVNQNVVIALADGNVCSGYISHRRPNTVWEVHDSESKKSIVIAWMDLPKNPRWEGE